MYNPGRPRSRFFWFPLIAAVLLLLLGGVVMWLWNVVVSPVTGVRTLTYGQGVGLLILCRILFGSFRRGGIGGQPSMRRGGAWRGKWMAMSPEERERFQKEWKKRCSPQKGSGDAQ